MTQRRPDFLIIGAAKAATSWLSQCLSEHPQIVIPRGELHYFSWYYEGDKALPSNYLAHFAFATNGQLCGENSNTYLSHPAVPARIYRHLPDVKLIVSLREPVGRAYADYAMRLRQGYRLTEWFRFLDPDRAPDLWFLPKGMYFEQLQRFLQYFDRKKMHFVLLEDIRSDPRATFVKLCRFLEMEKIPEPPSLDRKVNPGDARAIFPRLRRRLMGQVWGRKGVEVARQSRLFPLVRGIFGRRTKAPPLSADVRAKLVDYYRRDVEALSGLIGRDLRHWLE